jgi:hypothetical protein
VASLNAEPKIIERCPATDERMKSARKRRLAELVARGCTREEAARAVGISRRTAYTWLREPAVAALVEEVQASLLDPVESVLREALSAVKRDGSPDHAIRLRALELRARYPDVDEPERDSEGGRVVVYLPQSSGA